MKLPKPRRVIILILILILVILGGVFAWNYYFGGDDDQSARQMGKVERGNLRISAAATGTVDADITVDVKSRASGEVVSLCVSPGDVVRQGDLMVKLDPVDEERRVADATASTSAGLAQLNQAEAALNSARADAAEAEAKMARRQAAYAAGLVSAEENATYRTAADVARQSVAQREADLRSARASLQRSQLTIAEAKKRLNETVIRAPVSGTVLTVAIETGSIVASGISNVGGGTTLIQLADLSRLYVITKLDEAEIGNVKIGQPAEIRVDAFPAHEFEGVVERITPLGVNATNVVTFDVKVRVTDDSAALLFPGMSADVEITTARLRDVLTVPLGALRSDRRKKGERYVLLANSERRPIKVGLSDGARIVVTEGLQEGEEIVIAGGGSGDAAANQSSRRNPFSIFFGGRSSGGGRR